MTADFTDETHFELQIKHERGRKWSLVKSYKTYDEAIKARDELQCSNKKRIERVYTQRTVVEF